MLDFLSEITIEDVKESAPVSRKGATAKQRNPESGLTIRLFRDGSVYPSQALVEKFQLEYASEGTVLGEGNGFDIIDTNLFPAFSGSKRILLANPVSKSAGKVDLFGSTVYKEDGTPKSSVMSQGAKTFGLNSLIPAVEEIYSIKFYKPAVEAKDDVKAIPEVEGVEYVDLTLVANPATGQPWAKNVVYIPKTVSRGKDAGLVTTVRRENAAFYALLPASSIEQPASQNNNEAAELPENQQGTEDVEEVKLVPSEY